MSLFSFVSLFGYIIPLTESTENGDISATSLDIRGGGEQHVLFCFYCSVYTLGKADVQTVL